MEWNSFVCFTVDEENCRELAKRQRKGKNRTRRKLKLSFLSELLCLLLIFTPDILLKFIHFQLCINPEQTVKITCSSWITSYPYPHLASPQTSFGVRLSRIHFSPTDVRARRLYPHYVFDKCVFTNKLILRLRCHFGVCSGKF